MPNKIKYGLKNVHVATQTESDGEYTYGTPQAIPGAVSLSLDAEGESSAFYADDIVYYKSPGNNGYSGDLELALIPEWFRINVLGETKDTNGVLVEKATSAQAVRFALLFEFQGDVNAVRHVMYNCTCGRPSVGSQTKEDNIEPQTETLSLSCEPRADGLVKTKTGDDVTTDSETYTGWYDAVYVPTEATGSATNPANPANPTTGN